MADVEKDIVLRVKSETDQATGQFKNLKQELRSIEGELNKMASSGDTGSEAFKKLQQRAGQVKDQINDTKGAIKALSSDTFRLDAFAQGAQAIAGGFASAQGALALFGSENKQVEEAIKKTQGAMALLQGVTAITNVLQKESALRLAIATTAQTAYTAVVGASSGAMKIFRLALASTGIGALVVGLGLLIANFDDVKKVVMNLIAPFDGIIAKVRDFLSTISFGLIDDASTAKTKENAEKSMDAINKLAKANESIEKQMQRNIDIAKAKGKNDKEVFELEKQLLEFRLKNNYAEQEGIKRKIQAGNATDEERKKLLELVQSARDLLKDKTVLEINYTNKQKEETAKRIAEAQKESEAKRKELEKLRSYEAEYEEFLKKQREKNAKDFSDRTNKEYDDSIKASDGYFNHLIVGAQVSNQETEKLELQKLENQLQIQKDYGLSTTEIEDQIALKKKEIKDKEAKDEADSFAKRKATAMEWAQVTMDGLNALSSLNEAFSRKDVDGQKKAFERDKKFKIASAITATAMGVAQQLAVPQDQITGLNFAKAAIVLATGVAQIKKISDTQFQGGTPPTMNNNVGGNIPSPSNQATQTAGLDATQLQLDAQGNLMQQRTMRTYVLETDISAKQQRSKRLQQTATLGK